MSTHARALSPLAGALLLALHAMAQAAPAPDMAAVDLDKVEVHGKRDGYGAQRSSTATKTDTALRDTPQSVSVVTQELIRDQAMTGIADVVRYMPGVGIAQGEGNRDTPVLRGNSTTADLFIDGMRDDVQYYRDLYNIDRVEVLKGPNAMIFGRGGTGGVVNRVSKVADGTTHRDVSLQVGDYQRRRATADIGQALGADASLRVTALYEDSESWRDGFELQHEGINPTFAWRAGEATDVVLGYEYFHDERVADRGVPSFQGLPVDVDPSTFFGNPALSPTWAKVNAFNALVEHRFAGGAVLRNRTRVADYDKFYQNVFPGAVNAAGTQVAIQGYSNGTQRSNLFNQTDLVFRTRTGAVAHTLLAGVELGRQETDNFRQSAYFGAPGSTATSALVPLAAPLYTGPVEFRQSATDADNHGVARVAAAYVQDQVEFSPHWQAIAGLRYDRFEARVRNNRSGEVFESNDGLLSPRLGLVYKPVEPVSLYASYSLAYLPRAGEQLGSLNLANQSLDPEKFTNYELGAKWDVTPDFALTAAAYRLERSNVAVTDPDDATRTLLVDGQRTRGAELGFSGRLTQAWSVVGGYAWQDGRITRALSPTLPAGTRLAQLPRQSASLWNRVDFSRNWGAGLGIVYRDDIYASTSNRVRLKGYTRYDAALFYRVNPALQLQLNVENLSDKRYAASAHSDNNITPGSPRAFYLTANLSF